MFQDWSARLAVERYVEIIPNSAINDVTGSDGPGQTIRFTLANRPFIAFNSPIGHDFGFTPSMSIFVTCDTPDEVDDLFARLSTAGSVMMPLDDYGFSQRFGWCTDRYGVSWQIGC
jgi:predicted 3-demethylubiquinone-9 3-methyltransferase (glyoxalase superfamily)